MVSKTYGVAKKANVYGFKVLDSSGNGDDSGVIAAIDAVPSDAAQRNCPKGVVVNLSLGAGFKMQAMNDAVANLVKKNIFVAAAAGNSFKDAKDESPASEPTICTVGATDSGDNKAFYSNHGSVLDIQAPGSGVVSIVPGGRTVSFALFSAIFLFLHDANCQTLAKHGWHLDGFSPYRWSSRLLDGI